MESLEEKIRTLSFGSYLFLPSIKNNKNPKKPNTNKRENEQSQNSKSIDFMIVNIENNLISINCFDTTVDDK